MIEILETIKHLPTGIELLLSILDLSQTAEDEFNIDDQGTVIVLHHGLIVLWKVLWAMRLACVYIMFFHDFQI